MNTLLNFLNSNTGLIYFVTLIVLTFGLRAIVIHSKEVRAQTLQRCANIYRDIVRKQQRLSINTNADEEEHRILIRDHLGLVTEELFYMRSGLLPKELAMNWVRRMIQFIPIRCDGPAEKCIAHANNNIVSAKSHRGMILNKEGIMRSTELKYFLKHSTENDKLNDGKVRNGEEEKYNEYITEVCDEEVFTQIDKVFRIPIKKIRHFTKNEIKGQLSLYDEDTKRQIAEYMWFRNKIHGAKRFRRLSILVRYNIFLFFRKVWG